MANKKDTRDPSDAVHDVYRCRNAGVVDAPFNSKPYCDNFHVDRSRLGEHEKYVPGGPNSFGRFVKEQNDILENVRRGMGEIKHRSSFKPKGE